MSLFKVIHMQMYSMTPFGQLHYQLMDYSVYFLLLISKRTKEVRLWMC